MYKVHKKVQIFLINALFIYLFLKLKENITLHRGYVAYLRAYLKC